MKIILLVLAALTSVADVLKGWFGWAAKKKKEREEAAKNTSGKTFYALILLLFIASCRTVYVVSTPLTFDPSDYQPLKQGQSFDVPKDGIYFSDYAKTKWIKAKIAEYEIRKRGFDKSEE